MNAPTSAEICAGQPDDQHEAIREALDRAETAGATIVSRPPEPVEPHEPVPTILRPLGHWTTEGNA